ncbi:pentapeptide repeat-containing protein [Rhodococcus opacus]|uniref:pentapeptide repeat-containing protein n=1 Tax=Rhodococcus opacus TaxID=37919 RepID=UPI00042E63B5|nr:pentapeptide repeat-containing protein [Rhodococcus opacus]AHK35339.1 Uncharacterized protein in mobD 3'region [Rhodococcus opacus PD630]
MPDTSFRDELRAGLVAGIIVAFASLAAQAFIDNGRADRDRQIAHEQNIRAERLENVRFVRDRSTNPGTARNEFAGFDLSAQNLFALSLDESNFSGAGLHEAILFSTSLNGALLIQADLSEAVLTNAQLVGANLYDADMKGADLRFADVSNAILGKNGFFGADLRGTNFSDTFHPPSLLDSMKPNEVLALFDVTGACYDEKTIWPKGYTPPPPNCSPEQLEEEMPKFPVFPGP